GALLGGADGQAGLHLVLAGGVEFAGEGVALVGGGLFDRRGVLEGFELRFEVRQARGVGLAGDLGALLGLGEAGDLGFVSAGGGAELGEAAADGVVGGLGPAPGGADLFGALLGLAECVPGLGEPLAQLSGERFGGGLAVAGLVDGGLDLDVGLGLRRAAVGGDGAEDVALAGDGGEFGV